MSPAGISRKKRDGTLIARLAVQHAALREREIEPAARARERDVHEPPLFLDAVGFGQAVLVRERALFETADEDRVELETFRRMHGHELQRVRAGFGLVLARFQRRMREERGEVVASASSARRPRRLRTRVASTNSRRGVDQLRKVLEPVGAFSLVPVVLRCSPLASITCSITSGSG